MATRCDNIYLSQGQKPGLHRAPAGFKADGDQRLDHLGFFLRERADVDEWYQYMLQHQVTIKAAPKDHRDGTRSFYCAAQTRWQCRTDDLYQARKKLIAT